MYTNTLSSCTHNNVCQAPAIQVMSSAMIRAYCHKVIKLSGVLQSYAPEKECVENVHGVRENFINEGRRRSLCSRDMPNSQLDEEEEGQVYYIGKILWAKGFEQMLELEEFYRECTGKYFSVDIYGGGPEDEVSQIKRAFHGRRGNNKSKIDDIESDSEELQLSRDVIITEKLLQSIKISSQEFELPRTFYEYRRKPVPVRFLGPVDHGTLGEKYKVFVNPSVSEVLCTTTYEALAMGKFVIIPDHESNKFFLRFPNCESFWSLVLFCCCSFINAIILPCELGLAYRDKWEFAANLR